MQPASEKPVRRRPGPTARAAKGTAPLAGQSMLDLAGIAASLGSACAAGSPEPSHVLRAMGRSEADARSGLRLSLGPATTADEVDHVIRILPQVVAQIRAGRAA